MCVCAHGRKCAYFCVQGFFTESVLTCTTRVCVGPDVCACQWEGYEIGGEDDHLRTREDKGDDIHLVRQT